MIIIFKEKATKEQIKQVQEVYAPYTKTVIDIEKRVLAAGGEYHIDCEEVLIRTGSKQKNLFGGGYNFETKEVDFMAMSNYKPQYEYVTYEVADKEIREIMKKVTLEVFM